jgi:hypothetical protein
LQLLDVMLNLNCVFCSRHVMLPVCSSVTHRTAPSCVHLDYTCMWSLLQRLAYRQCGTCHQADIDGTSLWNPCREAWMLVVLCVVFDWLSGWPVVLCVVVDWLSGWLSIKLKYLIPVKLSHLYIPRFCTARSFVQCVHGKWHPTRLWNLCVCVISVSCVSVGTRLIKANNMAMVYTLPM